MTGHPKTYPKTGGILPETNIAPENRPLEKEIPIGNHHFYGQAVSFREGIWKSWGDNLKTKNQHFPKENKDFPPMIRYLATFILGDPCGVLTRPLKI